MNRRENGGKDKREKGNDKGQKERWKEREKKKTVKKDRKKGIKKVFVRKQIVVFIILAKDISGDILI